MPARKDDRGQWYYRKWATDWRGNKVRIFGTPAINTRAASEAAERAHIARVSVPPAPGTGVADREVQTLATFVRERWWPTYPPSAGNAATTLKEKEIHLRVQLLPALGHLRLDAIKGEVLDAWFASLTRAKLSPKYTKNLRATLRKILVTAQEWGEISTVPAIPKVRVPDVECDWFTADETRLLLDACRSPEERCMILFAVHTGARSGEQRVLEWGDLDFVSSTVTIRRSWAYSGSTTKAPKSGKQRTIPLTHELVAALKAIRGLSHLQGGLVFPDPYVQTHGGTLAARALNTGEARTFTSYQLSGRLGAACRRAGLREIRWHDLRHSFASQLASAGKSLQQIQRWMGHSSIRMTERYAKFMPSAEHADINALCVRAC